jgi:hypothetical protein
MSFSNTDYLYDHLPARFRREDKDLLLKRYLQFAGDTLDEWDAKFDAFFESIDSETADSTWVTFWIDVLFGWSWFPSWFRLADKRRLYGNMGRHLARRGTARGIELWLKDFGIVARVHTRAVTWGEFVWGETSFSITQPLYLIVEILRVDTPLADQCFYGQEPWGESFYTVPAPPLTETEVIALIRYMQPHAQSITIAWRLGLDCEILPTQMYWSQISW